MDFLEVIFICADFDDLMRGLIRTDRNLARLDRVVIRVDKRYIVVGGGEIGKREAAKPLGGIDRELEALFQIGDEAV